MEDWYYNLSYEDKNFIKHFLVNSGSLKSVAEVYSVSYPTVRSRLNDIINKINFIENKDYNDDFVINLMNMVTNDEINLSSAKKIINNYKRRLENE